MHIRLTALMSLVTLLCVSVAFAAPTKLSQQGRLLDGDSQALTGTHALVFKLFDAETAGTEVWQEDRAVSFEEGYYSIVLGEQVPLSDLLFAAGSVWLELTVDGAVLSPRQEVVSVPYALRAAVAGAVEGGPVDADEISVGGSPVIDSNGNWVGTAVDWSELTGVPTDLTDGDADTDTLLGLPCADGFVAKYSASLGAWDCAQDNDTLGGLSCQAGEIPVYEATAGLWVCGVDVDTDTNTQLTEVEVDAFVANNDYSTGAHTVDTNTQLTNAQVAVAALGEGFVAGSHTVDTNTQLTNAQVAAAALGEGFVTGSHTVNTDTQLTEAQVDAMVANNGYLAPDSSGNVGIGTANPSEVLTVAGIIESTSGGVKFPDGSTQASAAGGVSGTIIYTRCAWTETRGDRVGTCAPPACPSSWTDMGVNGNVKTDSYCGGGNSCTNSIVAHSSGYQERACHSASSHLVLTPRCAWTIARGDRIGTCTPVGCPSGWTDLGVTGAVKMSTYCGGGNSCTNSTVAHSSGYQERTCTL